MSKLVRIITGAVLVVAGVVFFQPQLVLAGAQLAGGALLQPGMKKPLAQATSVQIGEVPRGGIFGEAAVPGSLVDAFNHGGKYGTDWTVLVMALADHRCESLEGFYVGDTYVAFTGDGVVTGYNDQLEVYWRPGTWDQAVPAYLTTNAPLFPVGHPQAGDPTWTSDDRGRGVCYVVVAYKADKSDAKDPVWTNGRPQFLWVLKGLHVYSARDDSSIGGSGAHRWDDPTTREWSNNLYDCRYTWERGIYAGDLVDQPEMLLLGRGLTAEEAPPENVFAPANVCDEAVPLKAGGTEPRYTCNGTWSAGQAWIEVEEMFAAACGGVILEREGAIEMEPGQAKSPVWFITDDDLLSGTQVKSQDLPSRADSEWLNTVSPRYVEPSQKYKDHSAPVRRDTADIIADGGPREATPGLDFVTSGTQAQRVGEMTRRLGRLWKRRELTLGPRFAGAEHGDWVQWTSERYGGVLLMRIQSDGLGKEWRNALTLREVSEDYADWTAAVDELDDMSVVVNSETPGGIGEPDPGNWTLSAAGTSLVIQGDASDDEYVTSVVFEYSADASPDPDVDADWSLISTGSQSTTRAEATGLTPGTAYYGAVSYVIGSERGDRLVLGPETTDAADEPIATDLNATGGVGEADLTWRNPDIAGWAYLKVHHHTANVFASATAEPTEIVGGLAEVMMATITGLSADTHYFWVVAYDASDVAFAESASDSAVVT